MTSLRPNARTPAVHDVAPGVTVVPIVLGGVFVLTNCYLVGEPGGPWVAVDTGAPGHAERVRRAVHERFGEGARPEAIVLTHAHFDHAGNADALAAAWDVPVYAHPLELPYLTGRDALPPLDPTVGGFVAQVSRAFPESAFDLGDRVRPLPEDGSVPGMPGWRWLHTPGHTPGHVSFFRERGHVLLGGDAVVTVDQESAVDPLTLRQRMRWPSRFATYDWPSARASVQALAALAPLVVATGHGEPMVGTHVAGALQALADRFDAVAIPRHGRYVGTPIQADERGLRYVPPPVPDPLPRRLVAGAGAAALSSLVAAAWRRRRG